MVDVIRHHFRYIYFIVPDVAMSAGTIFCMSGDKIFMDYCSSLGPIDPQVPDRDDKFLVPALNYLDKIEELLEKSRKNSITAPEMHWLAKQDLATLKLYEQARDLSIELLKKWLATYKFKDWTEHRTTNPGEPVLEHEKQERAREIAKALSDNNRWYSHSRRISRDTLWKELRLEIDDFGDDEQLKKAIRGYSDPLTQYIHRQQIPFFLYNRHVG